MTLVRTFHAKQLLAFAGIDQAKALGAAARRSTGVWIFATPVSSVEANLESSKFFKSVRDNVDDDEKRAHFAVMINSLDRAGLVDDYASVLDSFGVTTKVACHFDAYGRRLKLSELKHNNKERIYYYPMNIKDSKVFVFLLAEHKKTNQTSDSVKRHCEGMIKELLRPSNPPELVK